MVWWRTLLLVIVGILLAVTLLGGIFVTSFGSASERENLRTAVNNDALFTGYYEKTYSCGTIGCLNHRPDEGNGAVFLTAQGHKLFSTWALESVILFLALLIAVQFLAQTWFARLLTVSIAFIASGLGLISLAFKTMSISFIPPIVQEYVAPGYSLAFSAITWWCGAGLLIGIILLFFSFMIKKHEVHHENPVPI